MPGEALVEPLDADRADVEVDVAVPGLDHLLQDAARDDVTRREVGPLVVVGHEPVAGLVDQHGALAAHRLGDQRARRARDVERRRVELHERHVLHHRARPVRHRQPVARRGAGVGRLAVDLAAAARREDHRPRPDHLQPVLGVVRDRADTLAGAGRLAGRDQVEHEAVFEQADAAVRVDVVEQRRGERLARRVAVGVDDAAAAVPALPAELEPAARVAVQLQPRLDQVVHPGRAVLDHPTHDRLVAEPGPGGHRVGDVLLRVVVRVQHRGDPALGPVRARVLQPALGRDDDLGRRALLHRRERRAAPRHPRADHQHIGEDLRQQRRAERDQVSALGVRHGLGNGVSGLGIGALL